jgi:hypothetical protein
MGIDTLKQGHGFTWMHFTGSEKENMEFMLTAIPFNLKRQH